MSTTSTTEVDRNAQNPLNQFPCSFSVIRITNIGREVANLLRGRYGVTGAMDFGLSLNAREAVV